MKTIATIGSIIADLAVKTPRVPVSGENVLAHSFKIGPGGKGANASVGVARMGASSILVGCIGNDDFGKMELSALKSEGVNIKGVKVDSNASTGVAIIMVDDNSENTILVVLGANANLYPEDVQKALQPHWKKLDAILVNFEIPEDVVAKVCEEGYNHNVPVIVDAGPPRNYSPKTWRKAKIISPNRLEIETLVGYKIKNDSMLLKAAKQILSYGPEVVVIKRGKNGILLCSANETIVIPAYKVKPVDTTGAGDAFTSAFTVAVAEGCSLQEAVRFGNVAGAIAVTRFGTLPAMPTRAEIEKFKQKIKWKK
ncbi:MAG: PfkB family carbohydrate kinase [Candidatus Firestonebacteria bacterium]